jgi:hypothetical protein
MMKSLLKYLFVIAALSFLIVPAVLPATAAGLFDFHLKPDCDPTVIPNSTLTGAAGPCNLAAFTKWLSGLLKIAFEISIPIFIGLISWGAFVMITAAGDPGKFSDGKKKIVAAVIGFAIVMGSNLIVTTLANALKK